MPQIRIVVGRWGPPELADETTQLLRESAANLVASTLLDTQTYLAGLLDMPRVPATSGAHAAQRSLVF